MLTRAVPTYQSEVSSGFAVEQDAMAVHSSAAQTRLVTISPIPVCRPGAWSPLLYTDGQTSAAGAPAPGGRLFAAYRQAVGGAWATPNEIRKLEDLPPREDGDGLILQAGQGGANAGGEDEEDDAKRLRLIS